MVLHGIGGEEREVEGSRVCLPREEVLKGAWKE